MDVLKVSEFVKKFGREHVLIGGGKECDKAAVIAGHWLYVRRCKKKSKYDVGPDSTIVIPEALTEQTEEAAPLWVEVLAKGCRVGKRRERGPRSLEEKLFRPPKWGVDQVSVGDLILVTSEHAWGIVRSPWADDEFLVDESLAIAKLEE